jgi:hypothetical protein
MADRVRWSYNAKRQRSDSDDSDPNCRKQPRNTLLTCIECSVEFDSKRQLLNHRRSSFCRGNNHKIKTFGGVAGSASPSSSSAESDDCGGGFSGVESDDDGGQWKPLDVKTAEEVTGGTLVGFASLRPRKAVPALQDFMSLFCGHKMTHATANAVLDWARAHGSYINQSDLPSVRKMLQICSFWEV